MPHLVIKVSGVASLPIKSQVLSVRKTLLKERLLSVVSTLVISILTSESRKEKLRVTQVFHNKAERHLS